MIQEKERIIAACESLAHWNNRLNNWWRHKQNHSISHSLSDEIISARNKLLLGEISPNEAIKVINTTSAMKERELCIAAGY